MSVCVSVCECDCVWWGVSGVCGCVGGVCVCGVCVSAVCVSASV